MAYSVVGIIAIFVHLIVNAEILFKKSGRKFSGAPSYFWFLISVIIFHIADAFWGIIYDNKQSVLLIIDTSIYFIGMALSILFWGMFVCYYLGAKNKFNKVFVYLGTIIFVIQIIAVLINLVYPILFVVTEDCSYSAGPLRYVTLALQIIMFLLTSIYTAVSTFKVKGLARGRYVTVFSFGVAMIIFISLQVAFPLLPMYSIGYLFGVCVLHTFVLEHEKAQRQQELEEAKHRVLFDPLTGLFSKHAYVDMEEQIDKLISENKMDDFAVVVFDLNSLKHINDISGHEAGDKYIIEASKLVTSLFRYSAIYRIGGDEFTAILEEEDYINRESLVREFNKRIDDNLTSGGVIVSAGLATYQPGVDDAFSQVFNRADDEMYLRKRDLKDRGAKTRE